MFTKSGIKAFAVSILSIGALAGTVAFAGGASAATTGQPHPTQLPRACATHVRASDNLRLNLGTSNFNYQVRLRLAPVFFQRGVLVISGTLCDTNEPIPAVLPVHGVIFGHVAVFSVSYPTTGPDAGNQGVRTFVGVIGPHGQIVGGHWSETGTEAGSGLFSLQRI
jgi:hypothetical protein